MTERQRQASQFLTQHGWADAECSHLAGDASDRSYQRLNCNGKAAILMDAPPGKGDDPADFMAISRHLSALGLSPPRIMAADLNHGFLLIEDLGDGLFARILTNDQTRELPLYRAATDVLIHLQNQPAPAQLPDLSAGDWAEAAGFAFDFYAMAATGSAADKHAFTSCLTKALETYADGPRVLILRDYHAENLLDLPQRQGIASVGLLDFQLAQMGQPGYDLISLLQDARRDVSPQTADAMIRHFAAQTQRDLAEFTTSCAVLGAQRALRILGIFARLCLVAGKPGYLALLPRVWGQLQDNLAHPALATLRKICAENLPAPTPDIIERIAKQCATRSL